MNILDRWNNFKRLMLLICAILMWIMSIVFSYLGFKSDVQNEWYFGIFALILSATITALELYLNSQTFEFSDIDMGMVILWIGGIAAYCYGIWTNVVGVSTMMIGTADMTSVRWTLQVVPIIVGILLEVLPEPMFVAFLKTKEVKKQQAPKFQQQTPKYHIPAPKPLETVSPHVDRELLTKLQQTHPSPTYSKR